MKHTNLSDYGSELGLQSILFHEAVANRLGLHTTDHKCLLFLLDGPKTAGYIASSSGLTTGGVTAAIDRLEQKDYVSRQADTGDRRRVMVVANTQKLSGLYELFQPLAAAMGKLEGSFSTAERTVIARYLKEAGEILQQSTYVIKHQNTI